MSVTCIETFADEFYRCDFCGQTGDTPDEIQHVDGCPDSGQDPHPHAGGGSQ
ncbi:hypothetical protein [Halovenus salina]|uniref:hypothetical protein n=1 Tax=Halovenus salina TaxID=1510225 RepID=UPI00226093EA|nr:hypothetical protein [Halovenus salina]